MVNNNYPETLGLCWQRK